MSDLHETFCDAARALIIFIDANPQLYVAYPAETRARRLTCKQLLRKFNKDVPQEPTDDVVTMNLGAFLLV